MSDQVGDLVFCSWDGIQSSAELIRDRDAELSPWMSSSGDEIHCTLNLSASRGWLAGANCADISPQDTGEDSNVGVRLEGEQGRRVTIQR